MNAESVAAAPLSADEKLAREGRRRAKNDNVFNWLKDLYGNVRSFMTAPSILLPMLADPKLKETLKFQGTDTRVAELVRQLTVLTQSYTARLQMIHGRHSSRRGSSYNADDLMLSIAISQDYITFTGDYEMSVLPVIQSVLELLEKAGLDTKSVTLVAGTGLVYRLFNEAPTSDVIH